MLGKLRRRKQFHAMARRLDILIHDLDPYDIRNYLVRQFIPLWEAEGIACNLRQGLHGPRRSDAVFLHVDLTRVPPEYEAAAREYPIGINVRVGDISKRQISDRLVTRDGAYDGPVIVKTNLNAGGGPEALHEIRRRHRLDAEAGREAKARIAVPAVLPPHAYPVFPSPAHVPAHMWRSPTLVVERFRPERQGDLYCLRQWIFFGDREVGSIAYSKHPVVKANRIVRRERIAEFPEALRKHRTALGFDYGKFDYVQVDGEVVLYDANRTPVDRAGRATSDLVQRLAVGIRAYLPE